MKREASPVNQHIYTNTGSLFEIHAQTTPYFVLNLQDKKKLNPVGLPTCMYIFRLTTKSGTEHIKILLTK
ncbi:MAG: hypothetical protein HBSAPP04_01110 [Ignavibacteriaceae bacterium]|nr:MAG: hypothetical protein HBSAPP04_01110 [Ignavibacteriaceae bacterium]